MGLLVGIRAWLIRIWHFLLCSIVIFGALFSTNFQECFVILGLLVFIIASQRVYKRCIFTEYEKADGLPSMSEIMKSIVLHNDSTVPLASFELMLGNIFVFILVFRMISMAVIPSKILFA
jgi:hypothetical protein|uniref:Uncharacterized protein n=1 Tax=viral metagenome TaxID=1070528 RepID=A0A6C0LPQ4_9ZZZZ